MVYISDTVVIYYGIRILYTLKKETKDAQNLTVGDLPVSECLTIPSRFNFVAVI